MHKQRFILGALALAVIFSSISARAATFTNQMRSGNTFNPRNMIVQVGDTVMWVNLDGVAHDTQSGSVWKSPLLSRNQTFSFTFNVAPGNYNYVCNPHAPGMSGTITVQGAA